MKLRVNQYLCSGIGFCEDTCAEVFELQSGVSTAKINEVLAVAELQYRKAMRDCPYEAVIIGL
jgi:ferredoxin